MGHINQAMVQERLFGGAERVPMILLVTASGLGIVIDNRIGLFDVVGALLFFGWGVWVLRTCAAYDPRLFANLAVKLASYVPFWGLRGRISGGRWALPAKRVFLRAPRLKLRATGVQLMAEGATRAHELNESADDDVFAEIRARVPTPATAAASVIPESGEAVPQEARVTEVSASREVGGTEVSDGSAEARGERS